MSIPERYYQIEGLSKEIYQEIYNDLNSKRIIDFDILSDEDTKIFTTTKLTGQPYLCVHGKSLFQECEECL